MSAISLTPAQVRRLRLYADEGLSAPEIGRAMGFTADTAREQAARHGVVLKPVRKRKAKP